MSFLFCIYAKSQIKNIANSIKNQGIFLMNIDVRHRHKIESNLKYLKKTNIDEHSFALLHHWPMFPWLTTNMIQAKKLRLYWIKEEKNRRYVLVSECVCVCVCVRVCACMSVCMSVWERDWERRIFTRNLLWKVRKKIFTVNTFTLFSECDADKTFLPLIILSL